MVRGISAVDALQPTIERSTFEEALQAAGAELICTPAVGEAWLRLLEDGSVDAFATEEANAKALCSASGMELYASPEPLVAREKAFALPFGRPALAAAVNGALLAMEADGTLEEKINEGKRLAAAAVCS